MDNKSKDNTIDKINSIKEKYKIKNLKIISSAGKLGKVRNMGIVNSSGQWIAFIDADEIANPNWLNELMKKTKFYDIILGSINVLNPNLNFITKFFDLMYHESIEYLKNKKDIKGGGTGNLLVNKNIFENGFYFDSNFPTAEDGDFCYRLYKRGYKFGYNEKAIIFHKMPGNMNHFFFFWKKMILGDLLVFKKHHDFYTLLKIIFNIFYFISPKYFKIYKKNNIISKLQFLLLGLTIFFLSLYVIFNPLILLNLKNKISRLK